MLKSYTFFSNWAVIIFTSNIHAVFQFTALILKDNIREQNFHKKKFGAVCKHFGGQTHNPK